jgi:hypothetical protein
MNLREYVDHWGTTPTERELPFPCDQVMPIPDQSFYRGISIDAAPDVVYRWLCQMKVAPYSYDWIDNLGRTSPRELTPGAENLEPGQTLMFIFKLIDFDENQMTLRTSSPLFGELLISYVVAENPTRLLVKLNVKYPPAPLKWLMRFILRWGDWFMMRKQLLTFKALAEAAENLP